MIAASIIATLALALAVISLGLTIGLCHWSYTRQQIYDKQEEVLKNVCAIVTQHNKGFDEIAKALPSLGSAVRAGFEAERQYVEDNFVKRKEVN